jgi:hypothetical protein
MDFRNLNLTSQHTIKLMIRFNKRTGWNLKGGQSLLGATSSTLSPKPLGICPILEKKIKKSITIS